MTNRFRLLMATSLVLSLTNIHGEDAPLQQTPYKSTDVFLSHPDHTVALYFSALCLQPSASNLHYAAEANPLPVPTPNWISHDIRPDYHFAFDLGLNAVFHVTNTNLMLKWEHFHSSDYASITLPSTEMLGPYFEIGPDAAPYTRANGQAHFNFNKGSLDYGVLVNFGSRAEMNFFAGVSYAYIKQILSNYYHDAKQTITRTITSPSSFSGAGPQVGVNFAYRIAKGFHLAGDASAALLIGPMKNYTDYSSVSQLLTPLGITPPNTQSTQVTKRSQLVPELEGKIGLAYTYTFCKHYMFSLEAGYQAQIYLNAIQSVDMGSEVTLDTVYIPSVGVYARTFQRTLSDFALAGPYLTATIGF